MLRSLECKWCEVGDLGSLERNVIGVGMFRFCSRSMLGRNITGCGLCWIIPFEPRARQATPWAQPLSPARCATPVDWRAEIQMRVVRVASEMRVRFPHRDGQEQHGRPSRESSELHARFERHIHASGWPTSCESITRAVKRSSFALLRPTFEEKGAPLRVP